MGDPEMSLGYRPGQLDDAEDMIRVEHAAQALLAEQDVHLQDLAAPDGIDKPTSWVLALVAELDGRTVGVARLTELDPAFCASPRSQSTLDTPTAA